MKIAACTGIITKDNQVLAVKSIKREKLGFPGGKRNDSETILQCLIREIKEETTLDVISAIYLGNGKDETWLDENGEARLVALFYIPLWDGTPTSSVEGETFWVSWEEIINPNTSYFPIWNSWAFSTFKNYIFSPHDFIRTIVC